jgi:Ni/Co efflux regulator RcnB
MFKKVLATVIASAFAASVFAQAQPAEPKGQTGTQTQKAQPAKPAKKQAKTQKKAQTHKAAPKNGAPKAEKKPEAGK